MKKNALRFFIAGFSLLIFLSAKEKEKTLLTVGEEKISVNEFKYVYNKNNGKKEDAYSEESLNEYLDLYVKFRLKVAEAMNRKMDTSEAFIKEFSGYKKQLAKPYFTEPGLIDSLTKEAYERMKMQVKAAHILIKISPEADPADTLIAYNKIVKIRSEIVAGKDFGKAAYEYSEDQSAQGNPGQIGYQGNLGYFSAFSMVYEFENAAFNTPVNEVSQPFRTRFGYHILKVNDKRVSKGKVRCAHIMIKAPDGISKEDSLVAVNKANEIYEQLEKGGDWNSLCAQFSEHAQTKGKNGELQPFEMGGRLGVPAFEKAAFELTEINEISKPVKSAYGWHIIKLLEKIPLKPYNELESEIKRKVAKDSRAGMDRKLVIKRIKAENNFKEWAKTKEKAFALADSTLIAGTWSYDKENKLLGKKMFRVEKTDFTVKEFFDYVIKSQRVDQKVSPTYKMQLMYDKFSNQSVLTYEEEHLEEKYEDYKMLTKEYKEGILLFDLMDKEIWSKASKDTAGIRTFYEANETKYQWNKRAKIVEYSGVSQQIIDSVLLGRKNGVTNEELLKQLNKNSALNLKVQEVTIEEGKTEGYSDLKWVSSTEQQALTNGRYTLIIVEEIIPASAKKITEARGLIVSDYQDELEKNWLTNLKAKYPVSIDQEVLKSLYK